MKFTVTGQYYGTDTFLMWEDGELTGTPQDAVDSIKRRYMAYPVEVGGQLINFDLDDFESSHIYLTDIMLEDAVAGGDRPEDVTGRIY